MPAEPRRVYLDACVLLAYVNNEDGRADIVQAILDDGSDQAIMLVTSTLSITEVAYAAEEAIGGLTTAGDDQINQLWTPASPITLVDVSQATTLTARRIIRQAKQQNFSIRSADAIHLATARMTSSDEVFTYENQSRRSAWSTVSGLDVVEPYTNTPRLDYRNVATQHPQ